MIIKISRPSYEFFVRFCVFTFFLSEVMAGPIRYYSAAHGLAWMIYLPKVELIFCILLLVASGNVKAKEFYIFAGFLIIYTLVGWIDFSTPSQALFGFWTMMPLLFALAAGPFVFKDIKYYRTSFLILYLICLSGIVLNYFHNVPWSGANFALGGHHLQTSRSWTDASFVRIAGFSRASFSAAGQVLILAVFAVQGLKSKWAAGAMWIAAGTAILVTTSKGVLLAYLLISGFYMMRAVMRRAGGTGRITLQLSLNLLAITVCTIMVVLPILTITTNLNVVGTSTFDKLLFTSFQNRLSWMWPRAFDLLKSNTAFLFGSGLGGLGTGQEIYDPLNYNAGDNLFVFLAVQYGFIIAVGTLAYILVKFFRFSRASYSGETYIVYLSLVLFMLVYGCLTNELEDGLMACAFGFCLVFQPRQRLA